MFFSHDFVGDNSWNGYENNPLFLNVGEGQFVNVARPLGSDCSKDSRGFGVADFDLDGKLDWVVTNNAATPEIYLNDLSMSGNYLLLDLEGTRSNRDAVGAVVEIPHNGRILSRHLQAGSGFSSQRMHTLHFGLGAIRELEGLQVYWPSGHVDSLDAESLRGILNQKIQLTEGVSPYWNLDAREGPAPSPRVESH